MTCICKIKYIIKNLEYNIVYKLILKRQFDINIYIYIYINYHSLSL